MSLSIPEFWKLVIESQLLGPEQCQQLGTRWGHVKGAAEQTRAKPLAAWLVTLNALSHYQAKILLAGRPGPFCYGNYRIYDRLESSTFCGAFRAVHSLTQHPVVLHFLTNPAVHDPRVWSAIAKQTAVRSAFVHPHLMRFFEAVDAGSHKFLVSQDLAGESAEDWVARNGALPATEVARIGRDLAWGLSALHDCGQVHTEVTPRNVWMDPTGEIKIVHSPANLAIPVATNATEGASLWKADYWAPELGHPGVVPDSLTDIYGLGCTLYFLLTTQPPFAGGTAVEKLARHATEPIQPLEPRGVPPGLAQIVAYAMAKNRAIRFPNAVILAEQLAAFVDPARLPPPAGNTSPTLGAFEMALYGQAGEVVGSPTPSERQIEPTPAAPIAIADRASAALVVASSAANSGSVTPMTLDPAVGQKLRPFPPRKNNLPILLASTGIALLVIIGGLFAVYWSGNRGGGRGDNSQADGSSSADSSSTTTLATNRSDQAGNLRDGQGNAGDSAAGLRSGTTRSEPQVVPDDGKLLWLSPTSGPPIDLKYVPHGGQFYIHVRPSALVNSQFGPNLLRSLGPRFATLLEAWEREAGVTLPEVDQLIGTLYANDSAVPRVAWVVYLKQSLDEPELVSRWNDPQRSTEGDQVHYQGKSWSYVVPADGEGKVFVMVGTATELKEALQAKGLPPVLRADLQRLLRESDSERHVSILCAPNFLFSELFPEGRRFYFGDVKRVRNALEWWLGDDLQAVMLSLHFGADFYWELRLTANPNVDRFRLATDLQKRLEDIPDSIFNYVVQLGSNPYWEKVRFQLPQMIRYTHKLSRVGVDSESAMINGVLPGYSAHNLVFGAELLIASAPGVVSTARATKMAVTIATIEELLDQYKTKIAFEANQLEFAVQDVAKDVAENVRGLPGDFKIKIMGDHLQLDGITRNQTVRNFSQSDKSIAEILTALVLKANPITTVKDPSETDQKLIWVIAEDPEETGKKIVLITTRQMAEKNKYVVPAVFRPKE